MFSFNFLPLEKIRSNAIELVHDVELDHATTQKKIGDDRQSHLVRIFNMIKKSSILVGHTDIELIADYQKQILEYSKQLKVMESEKNTRSQEYKNLVSKKGVYYHLINYLNAVISGLDEKMPDISTNDETNKLYNRDHMSIIITGLLLTIKNEIDHEYDSKFKSLINLIVTYDGNRSKLYKGIDKAIGITDDNPLDEVSKLKAISAYQEFLNDPLVNIVDNKLNNLNAIKESDVTDAKLKLKPTSTKECMSILAKAQCRDATEDEIIKHRYHRQKIVIHGKVLDQAPSEEAQCSANHYAEDEILLMSDMNLFATAKPVAQASTSPDVNNEHVTVVTQPENNNQFSLS